MGKVFKSAPPRGLPDRKALFEIELRLHEHYEFGIERIAQFAEYLRSADAWVFQESDEAEPDYPELVANYLDLMWPEFYEQMYDVAGILFNNRSNSAGVEALLYLHIDYAVDDLVNLWALSQPLLRDRPAGELNAILAMTGTIDGAATFTQPAGDTTDFCRWIFEDWLLPHLRFYRIKFIESEEKKEQERHGSKKSSDSNHENEI